MNKKYGEESQVLSELELMSKRLVEESHQLSEQIMGMTLLYSPFFLDSHNVHFRPRVLFLQMLHLFENVSYFPDFLYCIKRARPTSERIPNIMKFIDFEELLPYSKLQSTTHLRSASLIDLQPNTVLGVKIIATKTKATIIFISICYSMKL